MAKILCLESSTEVCSVCIHEDGKVIAFKESLESNQHSKKITLFIQACLDEANLKMNEIDAIAVSSGPGSYTGLRVGTATAKGLSYGADVPLIAISTLESMATGYLDRLQDPNIDLVIPMIDARRKEVYAAVFDDQGSVILDTFSYILDQDPFPVTNSEKSSICVIGNGAEKAKVILEKLPLKFETTHCSSLDLIPKSIEKFKESTFTDILSFSPSYFKAPNITSPKKKAF